LSCTCHIATNDLASPEKKAEKVKAPATSYLHKLKQWGIMGAFLFILPKCPLCIVALLTMVTGVGISAAVATSLQAFLLLFLLSYFFIIMQRINFSGLTPKPNLFSINAERSAWIFTSLVCIYFFFNFFDEQALHVVSNSSRIVYSCPVLK
jgi:hypothetical protein